MPLGRYVLPAALAGSATGVLGSDIGLAGWAPIVAGSGLSMVVLALGLAPGSRLSGLTLLLAAGLVAVAGGAWRATTAAAGVPGAGPPASSLAGAEEVLDGTVIDDPRPRGDRLQLVLGELVRHAEGGTTPVSGRVLVWMPRGMQVASGDRLRIRGRLEEPVDFEGFAYREYLARQGIGVIARTTAADRIGEAEGPASLLAGARATLLRGLNALVPEPEAALGAGILLGVRAAIAPEINDAFAAAGLTHVVAISGWNIAIVAAVVAAVVRPLETRPGGRWTTAALATLTVASYVVLTGGSPSVVRAALMAAALLVARLGGSRAHAGSALALAALLMLLAAPSVLWDVGFQLSLLATGGLIFFGGPVERRLGGWPAWVREPVALTLAAQLTTLPVVLLNFERLSLVAPLANILVVPFVPIAMLCAACAAIVGVLDGAAHLGPMAEALGWLTGGAAWLFLRIIISAGTAVADLPFAVVDASLPAPLAATWIPILALAAWALGAPSPQATPGPREVTEGRMATVAHRVLRPAPLLAGVLGVLALISFASRPDGRMHLTVLDVGQGDAILVEAPSGATMLVDGGPDPELTLRRLGANLPFFARRIDVLVLSHPHQDHVAGLVEVMARFRVGTLVHAGIGFDNAAYDRLLADAAAEPGATVQLARTGGAVRLDRTTTVEVLYPDDAEASASLPDGDINNGSVVLLLRHGRFSALLTGDAEAPVEAALLSRARVPPVDVLKVGHHGSSSSTTPAFIDAARPSLAVISSGVENDYGHPATETLATLSARPTIAVLRTDLHGDVEIVSDGAGYRVRTSGRRAMPPAGSTGSIGPWPSPIEPPRDASSTSFACRPASSCTRTEWPASPSPPPHWWRRPASRSTAGWSRPRRCCMTSTSRRYAAPGASTASSARGAWRSWGTRSSPCRSPPTRWPACSMRSGSREDGHRSSWPSRTDTWPRSS